ncbi:MAG: hypothetical protein IT311_10875 [Anaerolineales bacterium]|nr:hypothetical protein [Anaerolineales bacterium]MCZ2122177.1 hypothetical protein [Anaerolineales bacterium]
MKKVVSENIQEFLKKLGNRFPEPATLYLLGGSALILLGSSRDTLDIDYVGSDIQSDEFQKTLEEVAHELELETEAVPIQEFIPIAQTGLSRSLYFGKFGNIQAYIFDPYSIALSKLDRGFDTDLDDVIFLLKKNIINLQQVESFINQTSGSAKEFDIDTNQMRSHLDAIRSHLLKG